ncbi:protein of unknown function [[Clostridium] ultunense Esp]|uniref:Uncharacterized protein n=1 Tax=[Clostridium] ultunense Esp TaxID=1288971 RepID=A0A1M4PSS0_9FIRM|nr:protein of unknown function [[Clostridium] ultunense Esp]
MAIILNMEKCVHFFSSVVIKSYKIGNNFKYGEIYLFLGLGGF